MCFATVYACCGFYVNPCMLSLALAKYKMTLVPSQLPTSAKSTIARSFIETAWFREKGLPRRDIVDICTSMCAYNIVIPVN